MAAKEVKNRKRDGNRRQQLHHAHAQVAQAAVDTQRAALLRLWKEKADIAHAGGEVRARETAQQRDYDENSERRFRVLHGETKPNAGQQQKAGAESGPAAAADQGNNKGIRDAQKRAGNGRQRR